MFSAVVEAHADVQIHVAVAERRRVRELVFQLSDLQPEAAAVQFSQHLQKVGGVLEQNCRAG